MWIVSPQGGGEGETSDLLYYKSPSLAGVVVKALEGREERQGLDLRRWHNSGFGDNVGRKLEGRYHSIGDIGLYLYTSIIYIGQIYQLEMLTSSMATCTYWKSIIEMAFNSILL